VELFQPATELAANTDQLLERLNRFGLALIGLAGGEIQARAKFLGEHRDVYLYADRFGPEERAALADGYTLALHPHVFKKMHRLEDAETILSDATLEPYRDRLRLLPDTAHLTIAGDDPNAAIQQHRERLAAVHIKAWDSCYGRGSYRCFRGFTGPGKGVVPIETTLEILAHHSFPEGLWVVLEQDFPETTSPLDVYNGAKQLMNWGRMPKRGFRKLQAAEKARTALRSDRVPEEECRIELAYRQCLEDLALRKSDGCFRETIEPLSQLLPGVRAAVLHAYREDASNLVVLAIAGVPGVEENANVAPPPSPSAAALIGATAPIVETIGNQPLPWEKMLPASYRRFRIPIFNPYNPNHVRFLLDLYAQAGAVTWNAPVNWPASALAWRLGEILGRHLDQAVDGRCQHYAGSVIGVAAGAPSYADFARSLRKLVAEAIDCEAVAIFIADSSLSLLRAVGSDDVLEWRPDLPQGKRVYLARGDEKTDTVHAWTRALPLFRSVPLEDRPEETWKSQLKAQGFETGGKQILHFPIMGATGKCIGVVRCGGKLPPARYFHESDLAVLDAILHIAVPRLVSLQRDHARSAEVGIISHELKRPALAIRSAVEMIGREFDERSQRFGVPMLDYPWIDDVKSWCDLMSASLTNPDYFRSDLPLKLESVRMLRDVVAPIVRMLTQYLRDQKTVDAYRLDEEGRRGPSIQQGTFENIDRSLFIDKNKFQQVVFNLLDNAIKYAKPEQPEAFQVRFLTEFHDGAYWIRVQDWGIGIDAKIPDPDVLFEQGVRGPRAHLYQAAGTGYGLWIVRRLLALHKCEIAITKRAEPTEFSIRIPTALVHKNWLKELGGTQLT
jgi:signal transduction histidine kinase